MSRWRSLFFALIASTAGSFACAENGSDQKCDGGVMMLLGYRDGRAVSSATTVICASQCPAGTTARRRQCVWADCSDMIFCEPNSDGDLGAHCPGGTRCLWDDATNSYSRCCVCAGTDASAARTTYFSNDPRCAPRG